MLAQPAAPKQAAVWEAVMKSRLSSTVWTLVFVNGLALFVVIGLAFHAGREAADKSLLDFTSLPSGASGGGILAALLALAAGGFPAWRLGSPGVTPAQQPADFSARRPGGAARPPAGRQSPND